MSEPNPTTTPATPVAQQPWEASWTPQATPEPAPGAPQPWANIPPAPTPVQTPLPASDPARRTPPSKWNGLAIAGFILSFLISLVGLILSIIGFNQTKRSGEKGHGLALAGIIISIINMILGLALTVALVAGGLAGLADTTADTDTVKAPSSTSRTVEPKAVMPKTTSKPFADAQAYVDSSANQAFMEGFNGSLKDSGGTAVSTAETKDTIRYDVTMNGVGTAADVPGVGDGLLESLRPMMGGEAKRLDNLIDTTDGVSLHLRILAADGTLIAERTYTAADA